MRYAVIHINKRRLETEDTTMNVNKSLLIRIFLLFSIFHFGCSCASADISEWPDIDQAAYAVTVTDTPSDQELNPNTFKQNKLILQQLQDIYGNRPRAIVNMTLIALDTMNKKGVNEKCYKLLYAMRIFNARVNSTYAELLAFYSISRTEGQSHYETIENISALIDVMENPK
jgi:hypothetical protein